MLRATLLIATFTVLVLAAPASPETKALVDKVQDEHDSNVPETKALIDKVQDEHDTDVPETKALVDKVEDEDDSDVLDGDENENVQHMFFRRHRHHIHYPHRHHIHFPHRHHLHFPHRHHIHVPHVHVPHAHVPVTVPHIHVPSLPSMSATPFLNYAEDALTEAGGNVHVINDAFEDLTGVDTVAMVNEVATYASDYAEIVAAHFSEFECPVKASDFVQGFKDLGDSAGQAFFNLKDAVSEADDLASGVNAAAVAACEAVWLMGLPAATAFSTLLETITGKCTKLSKDEPTITLGATLDVEANYGAPVFNKITAGAEIGVGMSINGHRICYVGGCVGGGTGFPPKISAGSEAGVAVTLFNKASSVAGSASFLGFDVELNIPNPVAPGSTITLGQDATFFFPVGSDLRELFAVGTSLDVGPDVPTNPTVGQFSITSGVCNCPVCVEAGSNGAACGASTAQALLAVSNQTVAAASKQSVTAQAAPRRTMINIGKEPEMTAEAREKRIAELVAAHPNYLVVKEYLKRKASA